jgi:hypothetical protein
VAAGDLAREMLKPKVDAGEGARLSTVLLEDWLRSLLSVLFFVFLLVLLLPPPRFALTYFI